MTALLRRFSPTISLPVSNRFEIITTSLIKRFVAVWKHEKLSPFVVEPAEYETETEERSATDENHDRRVRNNGYIFADFLCPVSVYSQRSKPKKSFEILGCVFVELIKSKLITISYLNWLCVKLLRQEWEQVSYKLAPTGLRPFHNKSFSLNCLLCSPQRICSRNWQRQCNRYWTNAEAIQPMTKT